MLTLPPSVRIYLATGKVDLRRGHDGLGAIVRNQWKADIYGGHLFVFVGRRADRCKILFWDRGGFVLYYKRLLCASPHKSRYAMPDVMRGDARPCFASRITSLCIITGVGGAEAVTVCRRAARR